MQSYDPTNPWIVFSLDGEDYCVNSCFVDSIVLPSNLTRMPNNPAHVLGVMKYVGANISVIDLRTLLGLMTMEQAVDDFSIMRKMHLDWVDALDESVHNHTPFTKPVNPHKCKFGLWYDNYHTDNVHLKFILNKIEDPHAMIHLCGAKAMDLMAKEDWEGAEQKFLEAKKVCIETVIPLLDKLIDAYRDVNRGNIIVLRDGNNRIGLLVDEISRLVPGAKAEIRPVPSGIGRSEFISNIVLDDDHTLANLDTEALWMFTVSHAKTIEQLMRSVQ